MIRRSRVSAGESTPARRYRRACRSREDPEVPRYRPAASASDSGVARGGLRDPPVFRPPETSASPTTTRSLQVTTPPSRHQVSSGVGAGRPRSRVTSTLPALKRCPLTSGRRGARDGCGDPISTRPAGGSGDGNPPKLRGGAPGKDLVLVQDREKCATPVFEGRCVVAARGKHHHAARGPLQIFRAHPAGRHSCRSQLGCAQSNPFEVGGKCGATIHASRIPVPHSRARMIHENESTRGRPPACERLKPKDPGHWGWVRDCGTRPQ